MPLIFPIFTIEVILLIFKELSFLHTEHTLKRIETIYSSSRKEVSVTISQNKPFFFLLEICLQNKGFITSYNIKKYTRVPFCFKNSQSRSSICNACGTKSTNS